MWEGAKRTIQVNKYERNKKARLACIEHHGSRCKVCDIDFGEIYGNEFYGYIHVHHLTPVSEVNSRYEVDPKNDLIPLCPNCHAVIHYGGKTRTVEEIQQKICKSSIDSSFDET
nr:HNH endonuclease [Colwellia sp. D2M02]